MTKIKFPKNFAGIDGKKALEGIMNETEPEPKDPPTGTSNPLPIPTGDLTFVDKEDLYKEISKYIPTELPNLPNPLTFSDQVMKQSNPYLAVAVDMFCKKYLPEYRLATQLDLEQDLAFTKDTYNDTGLALRSLAEPNKSQAEYLFNQIKQRGFTEDDFPFFIQLRGLELDNQNFNLTDESLIHKQVKCLKWESGTNYSKTDNFGLPKSKNKKSSRQIWTIQNGLSRCYLNWISNLYADNSGLSNSNGNGRVVLAKPRSG